MNTPQSAPLHRALLQLGLLYFVLALVAIYSYRQPGSIATLWFANALGVAYLLVQPARRWPALLACCALALALVGLLFHVPFAVAAPFIGANLLEMALAAVLARRSGGADNFTDSPEGYLSFIALVCCVPPLLGATLGAAGVALATGAPFAALWPAWYAGSVIGAVGLLPLAVLALRQGAGFWRARIDWGSTAWYIALSMASDVLALLYLPYPFVYVMLPLIAAAVRLGFEGAALTIFLSSLTSGTVLATGFVVPPALISGWQFLTMYLPVLLTMIPPMVLAASMQQGRLREQGRRAFERELKRNHEELQTIIDHMPSLIAYWDIDQRNRFGNRALLDTFGLSAEQMRGRQLRDVIGPELYERNREQFARVLGGETVMFERTTPDAGGRPREVMVSYVPDLVQGAVHGFYAFVTDITPIKRAQQQEQAAQAQLQGVIDAASDFLIVATGMDGKIGVCSAAVERLMGYRADELVGKHTPLLWHDVAEVRARRDELAAQLGRDLNDFELFTELALQGPSDRRPWTFVRKDGSRFTGSLMVTTIREPAGRVIGFLGVAHDITEQLQLQASLVAAKEQAESASRAKSEFVANMSHEIRTPLNAVLGMAHLLGTTELTAVQKEYLDMIRVSGQSLLGVLNDILDFSKVEAGRMELALAPFALGDVLGALANIMTVNAGEKDLELAIGIAPGVPSCLVGDEMRLQQVLVNLTGNAIKFTEQGEVSVLVERVLDAADGQAADSRVAHGQALDGQSAPPAVAGDTVLLRFSVRDTGIGMDAAQQAGVFSAFSQADTSMTRRFGGTGLGLTICKQLTELMGGAIAVTSTPGQGSAFSITLPLRVAGAECGDGRRRERGELRLLVVDDNRTSRDYLCQTIEAWNWQADSADSGAQAVARLQAAQQRGARYDAVLVDWQMPGMDGLSTMRALRQLQPEPGLPVFIMAGAYGRGKLIQQSAATQADAILVKPVTGSVLFDCLQDVLTRRSGDPRSSPFEPRPAPAPAALDGARLLLVEDNPLNQIVARGVLEKAGAAVAVASDGLQALALLRADPAGYDLVLMDVQMPVMDGFAATQAIRRELGLALPVLAMTAGVMASEREQCTASGMDDFIAKPLDIEQMFATIAKHLPPR